MALKLVKTVGGSHGSPQNCSRCLGIDFRSSGVAWHCLSCQTYYPTSLGFDTLKKHIQHLEVLRKEFKRSIDDLEHIVNK